jgi:two-component system, NtrC family, sensor kinase
MRFVYTLTFRVLVGSCLLIFAVFTFYSYVAVRFHTNQMMTQVNDSADRVSDIIKQSTHYSMLLNRREDVFQIITTIGREPGVDGIRIYNKRGEIMFSTDKQEEGKVVDMHAEACYGCHNQAEPLKSLPLSNRSRVYWGPAGHRNIGLINPIRNEPSCSNADCHAHPADRTVLGVLDVRMSLAKVDAKIAEARKQYIFYAAGVTLAMALISGLFLYLMVHRPVAKLMEGTRQISSGNLAYHIPEDGRDEINALATMFNEMTRSLERARRENEIWSETLEKRVEQKSLELQQIHDRMLQIEKMASLGKLSATVAHELNNPLEGILTYGKLIAKRLRKDPDPSEAARQTLEELDLIVREVQRCGNIVKNLLLFSKKQVGEFGMVQAQTIVDKAVQLMQHHMKISNVSFEAEFLASDTTLMCDENQIQQALVALIVNAVEAMQGGGILRLRVDRNAGGDLRIHLADTGPGIAKEDIPHLFEPFFSTKKEGQGVGLGLSVVYGIVERHGGTISVQSEVGKGTIFTLTFPPATTPHPRVELKPEPASPSSH